METVESQRSTQRLETKASCSVSMTTQPTSSFKIHLTCSLFWRFLQHLHGREEAQRGPGVWGTGDHRWAVFCLRVNNMDPNYSTYPWRHCPVPQFCNETAVIPHHSLAREFCLDKGHSFTPQLDKVPSGSLLKPACSGDGTVRGWLWLLFLQIQCVLQDLGSNVATPVSSARESHRSNSTPKSHLGSVVYFWPLTWLHCLASNITAVLFS